MNFLKIQIDGFGNLVNKTFEFVPGLNVIFGPNEVGKSTLQKAILAMLFGFFEEGRITAAKRALQDLHQPWDENASFSGSLTYTLDDGSEYRVVRRFKTDSETLIFSLPQEINISSQFRSADRGRLFIADQQLGINKIVFEKTCFLRQAELIALDASAEAITETLMRLSASASTNTTAIDALSNLETVINNEIGSKRAYSRPLAQAINHLNELERERKEFQQKRSEVFTHFRELNQCEDQLNELEAEKEKTSYKQKLADYKETKSKLDSREEIALEIVELATNMEEKRDWEDYPVNIQDDILELNVKRNHLHGVCQKNEQGAISASNSLREISEEIRTKRHLIKSNENSSDIPIEEIANIRDLESRLDKAESDVHSCQKRLNIAKEAVEVERGQAQIDQDLLNKGLTISNLAEMEQQLIAAQGRVDRAESHLESAMSEWNQIGISESKYLKLERFVQEIEAGVRPAPKPKKGCKPLIMNLIGRNGRQPDQTPKEISIYRQIKPTYIPYSQAREEYESSSEDLVNLKTKIGDLLGDQLSGDVEPTLLRELRSAQEKSIEAQASLNQYQKALTQSQSELNHASEHLDHLKAELKNKLANLGFESSNLQSTIQSFEEHIDKKVELKIIEEELEKQVEQAVNYKKEIDSWKASKRDLVKVEEELREILLSAEIDSEEVGFEQAFSDYKKGIDLYQEWAKAKSAYDNALKRQQMLLDGEDGEKLLQTSNELLGEIENFQLSHPEWVELLSEKSYRDYEVIIGQIDNEKEELIRDQIRLKDTIQRISNSLRDLAEIDEEIHATRVKINNLEQFREELKIAMSSLSLATKEYQKQYAPRIEALMGEGIEKITQNRYSDLQVDPGNLNVSLVTPELGKGVRVEKLSTGTRDMVYLMLRIAIAQYMSRSGEKLPLLLDDPLVQFDRFRLESALEYLWHLSQETQILIFTKDELIKTWFEKSDDESLTITYLD